MKWFIWCALVIEPLSGLDSNDKGSRNGGKLFFWSSALRANDEADILQVFQEKSKLYAKDENGTRFWMTETQDIRFYLYSGRFRRTSSLPTFAFVQLVVENQRAEFSLHNVNFVNELVALFSTFWALENKHHIRFTELFNPTSLNVTSFPLKHGNLCENSLISVKFGFNF